jgi:hypothetical protein
MPNSGTSITKPKTVDRENCLKTESNPENLREDPDTRHSRREAGIHGSSRLPLMLTGQTGPIRRLLPVSPKKGRPQPAAIPLEGWQAGRA